MSAGPDPQVDVNLIEQTRKQINRLVEEVARLSEMDLAPTDYYGEFLQRVLHFALLEVFFGFFQAL